jgi:beta-glucanase (GH16 family)
MTHVEQYRPYYILGDTNGVPNPWDTTQYPNGDYTLTATATNVAGQSSSLKIYLPIANSVPQPSVTPTAQASTPSATTTPLVSVTPTVAPSSTPTPVPPTSPWRLVFQDEFDGPTLDTATWNTAYWWGRTNAGNNEAQYYADDAFELGNSTLRIKAERRSMAGFDYTSGIITTFGRFSQTYGRFEMRAKVPKGQGLWPAFWLVPQSKAWPPEIDIFEILGHRTNTAYMANHWKSATGAHQQTSDGYTGPDFSQAFHTFAVEWMPSEIIWYVDGVEQFRSSQGIPTEPMYIIANLAVGGNWPGYPDGTTPFPSYLEIDYIRAYQRS